MYVPNLVFVRLAAIQPSSFAHISTSIAIEQFGYGFGFTAYMVGMMRIASGLASNRPIRPVHRLQGARHDAA